MAIHFRRTPMLALIGMLALGGATVAQAQDTTSATRSGSDTSGYQPSQSGSDTSMAGRDSSTQNGAPADTALKAAPGTQTGKPAGDSSATGASGAGVAADTVVCKDGSNAANGQAGCGAHGGIDSVSTRAAQKARGRSGTSDSSAAGQSDSSSGKSTSP
jgi:hypothetical protein